MPAAIGQENNQFTPIQLANYVATLANGGTHYSAHLLKEVKSSDFSQVVYQYEPEVLNELDLDPENLEAVTRGMLMVTQPGGSAYSYGFNTLDLHPGHQAPGGSGAGPGRRCGRPQIRGHPGRGGGGHRRQ